MLTTLSPKDLIPAEHPIRRIRTLVDEVLASLDSGDAPSPPTRPTTRPASSRLAGPSGSRPTWPRTLSTAAAPSITAPPAGGQVVWVDTRRLGRGATPHRGRRCAWTGIVGSMRSSSRRRVRSGLPPHLADPRPPRLGREHRLVEHRRRKFRPHASAIDRAGRCGPRPVPGRCRSGGKRSPVARKSPRRRTALACLLECGTRRTRGDGRGSRAGTCDRKRTRSNRRPRAIGPAEGGKSLPDRSTGSVENRTASTVP